MTENHDGDGQQGLIRIYPRAHLRIRQTVSQPTYLGILSYIVVGCININSYDKRQAEVKLPSIILRSIKSLLRLPSTRYFVVNPQSLRGMCIHTINAGHIICHTIQEWCKAM